MLISAELCSPSPPPRPATAGYKPGAAKSVDEYAKLDAEDESLARWKASLGIVPGSAGAASGPKVRVTHAFPLSARP